MATSVETTINVVPAPGLTELVGFTREALANAACLLYKEIYRLENAKKTKGLFGIWGHGIGDLVLHTIAVRAAKDGRYYAYVSVDS